MEARPFGVRPDGVMIRDVSGVAIRANLEFLEESVRRQRGAEAGAQAVRDLIRLLNERIPDPAYHVTDEFLRNQWNSYSYEFVSFLDCFCTDLSGDQEFQLHLAREKFVSPVILALARPFSTAQIFKVWPYFGEKYAPSIHFESLDVSDHRALLRVSFQDHVYQQFGPYRRSCARRVCQAIKGTLISTPERVHGLKPARVVDLQCIAKDDPYCQWEVTWEARGRFPWMWVAIGTLLTAGLGVALAYWLPALSLPLALLLALPMGVLPWLVATNTTLRKDIAEGTRVIQEQVTSVETRHEELRNAYLSQQQTSAVLRKKVNQLTLLHRAGLLVSSTLDREHLIQSVLQHIKYDLDYDRVMITFYDRAKRIAHDSRVLGVPDHVAAFARTVTTPLADPTSVEGTVALQGNPLLVKDIHEVWEKIHPLHRELATLTNTKSFITVPLKVQDRILGSLTVDRRTEQALTEEDLELMQTVAAQVAMALDNAEAYSEIEKLNIGLEAKVRERTAELARANEQLQEMDRLKSQFVAHVSHELRTPLTIITGFVDNMLEGVTGPLSEKQTKYLTRLKAGGTRLARMIANLLHRSRIEEGKERHFPEDISLTTVAQDVVEQFRQIATANEQHLDLVCAAGSVDAWADPDGVNRILTNLIENALKYTPRHGSVRVTVEPEGIEKARISVSDTGEGIAACDLPHLFDPFYRATRHQKSSKKEGLGLGLSIVKQLVDLHGGTISVDSREGGGSTFHVTLPRLRPRRAHDRGAQSNSKRILLVDDDPDIRQLLTDRLTADGYDVLTAPDGREAIGCLEGGTFDGLILDIGLPHIDGLNVLQEVRQRQHHLPVVMITAATGQDRALQAMKAGAQAYLLKPLDAQEFKQVIDRWFRGSAKASPEC
ncbi:hypothetical protein YTPLAS18_05260 [Nitrospira sp.]|nr:hypothetical protein YTPLAS18_05260 [Nitrospira sp.]